MPRIPEAELERLKREVSLQRLVEAKGIELKKHGADLIAHCPFHDDSTPSFVVSPSKNLWHCLGACQAGGSVIDFVMRIEGVSFRHAVELLRDDAPTLSAPLRKSDGRPANEDRAVTKHSRKVKLTPVAGSALDDEALMRHVVDYYHESLKRSPEALAYLEKRGLKSQEMIEHFKLGYSDRTLGYRLPNKDRVEGAELRGRLQALGLIRESGHEHFRGSIVIPVFGEGGELLEMYGRKVRDDLRAGTAYHLYLPGPHCGVWNVEALKASDEVILCEALIDALTFWCAGYRNVTSSYGVEGFTQDHLDAFKRYGTKRVLIAYDRDEAGDRAAEKLGEKLMAEGLECWRIQFPRSMDANEYALSVQPASKSLGLSIRSAVWIGKGRAPAVALGNPPAGAIAAGKSTGAASLPLAAKAEPPSEAPARREQLKEEAPAGESLAAVVPPSQPRATARGPEPARAGEASPALTASPLPSMRQEELDVRLRGEELTVQLGDRRWRVRGLGKNMSYDQLRVNVLCARGEAFHVDTLDLYSARQRALFLKQATDELGVEEHALRRDLGRVLLKLEELQDKQIQETLTPKDELPPMSEAEREAALELLRDPKLCERILADFEKCGVVGEETNKLVGYIGAVSRKLTHPLAIIIQSSSAAGKSALMEAILAFIPEEERAKYSAMTGQSLFYLGETDLKHKVLAIVEEEGAERASYALKLLQSEGELTIASTGKDPATGRHVTHEYRVEGPVMIILTTTAIEIDEELLNRCIVLTVDEEREQTRAIHQMQRRMQTLEGLVERKLRPKTLKLHQDAQRLLRPLYVLNPYAESLTFLDERTRTRRDHQKYLGLINAIGLLHQYQRAVVTREIDGERVECIDVTLADIALANKLAHQVLGRSLDELPPQTRRLLMLIDEMVAKACARLELVRSDYRFSRREVREYTGWGNTQLKLHLRRLEELEYLLVHRGGRGQSFVYELLYDGLGKDGTPFLSGLLDPAALRAAGVRAYDEKKSGSEAEKSGSSRPQVGPRSGGGRVDENLADPHQNRTGATLELVEAENAVPRKKRTNGGSYAGAPSAVACAAARG